MHNAITSFHHDQHQQHTLFLHVVAVSMIQIQKVILEDISTLYVGIHKITWRQWRGTNQRLNEHFMTKEPYEWESWNHHTVNQVKDSFVGGK